MTRGFSAENEDVSCFNVTKIAWRGRYVRVFSVGTHAISTHNPASLEITNQWLYQDFFSIKSLTNPPRSSNEDGGQSAVEEFQIMVRKKGGKETMRFCSEYARDVISDTLRFHNMFATDGTSRQYKRFKCVKCGWRNDKTFVVLLVQPGSLDQLDASGRLLKRYPYKDIRQILRCSNVSGGFALEIGNQRRRHFFATNDLPDLVNSVRELARTFLSIDISVPKNEISYEDFLVTRLGLCSKDEQLIPYVEFRVQKSTSKGEQPVRRLMCLSETCIIERDPHSYNVICARPLKTIVCLVRDLSDPQKFRIGYENSDERAYVSNERDSVLASLVDGTRASGNIHVYVTSGIFDRARRIAPFGQLLDEESELQLMKHIINPPAGLSIYEVIRRFNANVPYSGLTYSAVSEGIIPASKSRTIVNCIEVILAQSYDFPNTAAANGKPANKTAQPADTTCKIEAQLACLRRLFASKIGFQAFTLSPGEVESMPSRLFSKPREKIGIREQLGPTVMQILRRHNDATDYAIVEVLNSLMQPMHPNYELRLEQLNKHALLSTQKFVEHLLQLIVDHVNRRTGSLVIASMLDFLTYAVCLPYSETTPSELFNMVLKLVAERGRSFYRLFHSPSMTIVKGAGLVLKAIVEESPVEISQRMQNLSLTEGAFLKHLDLALFSQGKDLRVMANRQLSGQLISLWIADNSSAMELLKRCIPRGLLNYLKSADKAPVSERDLIITRNNVDDAVNETPRPSQLEENLVRMLSSAEERLESLLQHWQLGNRISITSNRGDKDKKNPVVLRRPRKNVKITANWRMFCYQFGLEKAQADLIWNEKTKSELKQTIERELTLFRNELEQLQQGVSISWNHAEFEVVYPSLQEEVRIGDYYLRFLLNESNDKPTPIDEPLEFFNNIYHRFLLSTRMDYKCICLKAMGIVYERHHQDIGSFPDSKEIVDMMCKCMSTIERDHYVYLISKLALNRDNVRDLITADVIPLLVDLACLAHLHVNRAKINSQTNVIDNGPDDDENQSKEWYYMDKDDERKGPFSFIKMKNLYAEGAIFEKTKIWAEGFTDYCHLSAVPQFRWTVVCAQRAQGSSACSQGSASVGPLYNLTELCEVILDTFLQMCSFFPSCDSNKAIIRPLPRVKKILSMPVLLYPIVQLLLTYDPSIVCRVAKLLYEVMQYNPSAPSLYLSGAFFFILMYNGSNILPVAKFLYETHKIQAFKSTARSDMSLRSILCPILPEAIIYYLDQHGPEEYAQKFLGEYEEPEVIWNSSMRRFMIEQIALHVSSFTSRLSSNIKVLYQFCPIPMIDYEQLRDELFCHYYYLRHLTDEAKFPNYPIRQPMEFLRACLATWESEILKKAPSMSVEQACKCLNLDTEDDSWKDPEKVRKAYYKLALKYHPDRNPESGDIFAKINAAQEFLTSALIRSHSSATPNFQKILICLRAQSIVLKRHLKELSVYKYAGYANLIKTIELEVADDMLFSVNKDSLLIAAVELCYWTLRCAPLNAEQLRRERGLDALYDTFERCSPMIGLTSKETDLPVQVCLHVLNCFSTAAKYQACRERICEMKNFFSSLCRLLKFEHLTRLACVAAECICAFSVSTLLQTQLFQAGVIWQLVPHLFRFDYTLDEGGVANTEESNQQAVYNRLARSSCEALSCLAGYRPETPDNDGVQNSLRAMLTPFVCSVMANGWPVEEPEVGKKESSASDGQLGSESGSNAPETESENHLYEEKTELEIRLKTYQRRNDRILKLLNSNTEDPYIIWDNATRAEMLDFVERHRLPGENSSELFGAEFRMSIYAKELVVGDIFVRIYNDQPNFSLYPKKVCIDLLDYLKSHCDELLGPNLSTTSRANGKTTTTDLIDLSEPEPSVDWGDKKSSGNELTLERKVLMVLEALCNVLLHNPACSGVELLLIGNFQVLFYLLRGHHLPNVQEKVLQVIWISVRNEQCVKEISTSIKIPLLLVLLVKLPRAKQIILHALGALAGNSTAAKDTLEYGGLIYILNIFATSDAQSNDDQHQCRLATVQILSKLLADPSVGPKWTRYMALYIPLIFCKYIAENKTEVIQKFDGIHENPELIWNKETRQNVLSTLKRTQDELVIAQTADPSRKWNVTLKDVKCAYESVIANELVVGGVYVRLFIANPNFLLREPRNFATELMEKFLDLVRQPSPDSVKTLEAVTKAMTLLFSYQTVAAEQISSQGYLPQFCQVMQNANEDGAKSSLLILKELSKNDMCSNAFGSLPVIQGLYLCMQKQPRLIAEAAHALKHLLQYPTAELAEQMLSTRIIGYLLNVLGDPLPEVSKPAAVKAEIVDALKSCCTEPEYGARINATLQNSSVWAQYRDQRHDLFLPSPQQQNAIAGPGGAVAAIGYLTDTMFEPPEQRRAPPPISPKPTNSAPQQQQQARPPPPKNSRDGRSGGGNFSAIDEPY